jgi:hypothetical protein
VEVVVFLDQSCEQNTTEKLAMLAKQCLFPSFVTPEIVGLQFSTCENANMRPLPGCDG